MKKNVVGAGLAIMFATAYANANEDFKIANEESVSPYYMTVKLMTTSGGTVYEEHETLKGDHARGIGIDVGYKFNPHFAVEFSAAYGRNDVAKTEEGSLESEIVRATYVSYALNFVFFQPLWDEIGFFAKLGYEKEHEKISALNISEDDYGVDYAIGFNYELNAHNAIFIEHERSTIDGLRGDAYFVGLEFKF